MEDVLVAVLVPLSFFGAITAISIASIMAGQKSRRELNETARRAIEAGRPLDPDTIAALHKPVRSREQDLRSGLVLTFLALGFGVCAGLAGAGLLFGDPEAAGGFLVPAVIVGAIGLGQLVSAFMRRADKGA